MPKRLRILFLNQYLPPDSAATARRLADVAQHLAGRHHVWVVAGRPSYSPGSSESILAGVHVVRTRSMALARTTMLGRALNYGSYLAGAFVRVWALPKPDVIVALTDPPFVGVVGAFVARRRKIPLIQIYTDLYPDIAIALGRADNPLLVWLWRRLNGYVRHTARRIVVVGRDMEERLASQGVPADRIFVRPNWAGEPRVSHAERAAARATNGWEGRFVVMFAGNLGLAQGLETLIGAATRLREREDVLITLVGDGAARPGLEEATRSLGLGNVRFLPPVPPEQAQVLVCAADLHVILLAPGLWGTAVPGKVYGIMAAGKPFVAAVDAGSEIDRIIGEHRCGVRVQPGDASGLADAIVSMVGGKTTEMGARGRTAFLANYTVTPAVDEYRALIEEAALNDDSRRGGG